MVKDEKSIPLQVRSASGNGKRLFDWDPADSTVSIISHGIRYIVKLTHDGYRMLEERPRRSEQS